MPSPIELLRANRLDRVAEKLAASLRPSIRICAVDYEECPRSRLGGRPNLPPDFLWPKGKNASLAFIAQLDLAAMPEAAGIDLPRSGSLYFFHSGFSELDDSDPTTCNVHFSDVPVGDFPVREFPEDLPDEEEFRFPAVHLFATDIEATMPGPDHALLDSLSLSERERTAYFAFLEQWDASKVTTVAVPLSGYPKWVQRNEELRKVWDAQRETLIPMHRVGGYPDAIQSTDPTSGAAERSGKCTPTDWQLLFQIDSEESAGILWGDVGRLYFLIQADDLRQRRFDRTWLVSDCH